MTKYEERRNKSVNSRATKRKKCCNIYVTSRRWTIKNGVTNVPTRVTLGIWTIAYVAQSVSIHLRQWDNGWKSVAVPCWWTMESIAANLSTYVSRGANSIIRLSSRMRVQSGGAKGFTWVTTYMSVHRQESWKLRECATTKREHGNTHGTPGLTTKHWRTRHQMFQFITKGSLGYLSSMYFSTSLVLGEVAGPFPEIENWESRTETWAPPPFDSPLVRAQKWIWCMLIGNS